MKTDTLDTLIWVLIYGGLIAVGLGLSVRRAQLHLGHGVIVLGALAVGVGLVLIAVRARIKDPVSPPHDTKASS